MRPPCVLYEKSVLRLCLIFEIHEIQRDIAVNGVSGANTTNLKPFNRLHRNANTIVEVVVPVFDVIIMVDRMIFKIYVEGAAIRPTRGFVAIADERRDIQPTQDGNLITCIDGQGCVIVINHGGNISAPTVFRRLVDKVDLNT